MKKLAIASLLMTLFALTACTVNAGEVRGSGTVTTEARSLSGIQEVTLATLGDLTIQVGDEETLTLEAEDNLLPHLESDVRGGTLTIRNETGISLHPTRPVRYYLTVKSLEAVSVSSSGNITAPEVVANTFDAIVSSSGNIVLGGLEADRLRVTISSNGNVVINGGDVRRQTVTISSSGSYEASNVLSEDATVKISSSGNATIWVTDSLDADLTSSGNVNYYGSPRVSESTSSSGRLVSLGGR